MIGKIAEYTSSRVRLHFIYVGVAERQLAI